MGPFPENQVQILRLTVGKRLVFSLRRPSGEQIVVQDSALAHATAVGNMARVLDTDARDGCNKSDLLPV